MKTNSFEAKNDLLIAFGDSHVGASGCDLKALKKMISFAEKTGAHLIGLGDYCEAIISSDKRFDLSSVDPEFLDGDLISNQYDYMEELLEPVKSQCIGLVSGNHDNKIKKYCHIDMVKGMCKNLNIPYLENSAFTRLSFKRDSRTTSFVIYATHSASAGSKGAKVNSMEKLSDWYEATLYLCGHSHMLFTTTSAKFYLNSKGDIGTVYRHYGNTGSFLRGIKRDSTSYAEEKCLKPGVIGYLLYEFDPELHKITGKEVIL